jgi:phosphoserine phosphatase
MDSRDAPRALDVIRALELPIALVFNRGRVMAMPQGVSKSTGLHRMLTTLRLSPRNAVAVGDAENDHELLRLAEVGYAVEWGAAIHRTVRSSPLLFAAAMSSWRAMRNPASRGPLGCCASS